MKHIIIIFLVAIGISNVSFSAEHRKSSLYVDVIGLPLYLVSEPEVDFYAFGAGAEWYINEVYGLAVSLNQYGNVDTFENSKLSLRGNYYFSGSDASGFYGSAQISHKKTVEDEFDCNKKYDEFRLAVISGYQWVKGSGLFFRSGLGVTTLKHKYLQCPTVEGDNEESGSHVLGEFLIGYSF